MAVSGTYFRVDIEHAPVRYTILRQEYAMDIPCLA